MCILNFGHSLSPSKFVLHVYPFLISFMFSWFAYFALKLICFPKYFVGTSLCNFPQIAGRIFSCFEMFCFVGIVLSCLGIFLVFLLLPVSSGLFPRVVLFVQLVSFFPFCPNMFHRFSFVLSFLFVVGDVLSAFPVKFPIKAFCVSVRGF